MNSKYLVFKIALAEHPTERLMKKKCFPDSKLHPSTLLETVVWEDPLLLEKPKL